jgi:hypothetical protein
MIDIFVLTCLIFLLFTLLVNARLSRAVLCDLEARIAKLENSLVKNDDDPDPGEDEPAPATTSNIIAIGKKAA